MLNLRVDDLDAMLELLRGRGVQVVKVFDPEPKFAHVKGPDGMVIELWEPAAVDPYDPSRTLGGRDGHVEAEPGALNRACDSARVPWR